MNIPADKLMTHDQSPRLIVDGQPVEFSVGDTALAPCCG